MRFAIFGAVFVLAHAATVAAQVSEPILQIGLFKYRTDGTQAGSAYDTEPSLESLVWTSGSLCTVGAGHHREAPAAAADAWRFAGRVIDKTSEDVTVQLVWQRVLEDGRFVTAPGSSTQLTLHAGDRLPLDSVIGRTSSACEGPAVFEVRYMSRLAGRPFVVHAPKAGSFATGIGAGGGYGSGVARGPASGAGAGSGGVSSGSASTAGAGTVAGGGARVGSGVARTPGHAFVPYAGVPLMSVDLWLVRSAPGKNDETAHQALRAGKDGAAFAFAPVTIDAEGGRMIVQITGSFAVTTASSGAEQFVFVTNRRAAFSANGAIPRDSAPDAQGGSRTTIPLPRPDDVVSFELPPLAGGHGRPSVADQFSIRVRITPLQ